MEVKTLDSLYAERKQDTRELYDRLAPRRSSWIARNRYYYDELINLLRFSIEPGRDILQVGCGN